MNDPFDPAKLRDLEAETRFAHLRADLDPLKTPLPAAWSRLAQAAAQLHRDLGRTLAIETGHIDDPRRVAWIAAQLGACPQPTRHARRRALQAVLRASLFESFMARRFSGKKRFGVEGAEAAHAILRRILDQAAATGVEEVVIGGMHRGRLGLMTCVLGQPLSLMFARMAGAHPLEDGTRAGDVPYHMGHSGTYQAPNGPLRVTLLPNPSHLEAVNAVAIGYARRRLEELGAGKVLPLLLHSDASLVGQGSVGELLQFAGVDGHSVEGGLHVVINNQIGFTTNPEEGRTSRWCTGQFKAIDSLIAHVNGDDVDAALCAADIALAYRKEFAGVAVIDLVAIRENGHNELDEPRFTQPFYYELAEKRRGVAETYAERLIEDRVVARAEIDAFQHAERAALDAAHVAGASPELAPEPSLARIFAAPAPTQDIAARAALVPQAPLHPKVARLIAQRAEEWRNGVSWALAETLAFGSVLSTGRDIRFTGQDIERGAFSHRHLAAVDAAGRRWPVFANAPAHWGRLCVLNTPLSEYAALAYAYGYSVAAPDALTIWEAQFGDFANGAQIVIDQFVTSGFEKWGQRSGLVVLLPHGLEGQGPEHSSARIERWLQLAAKDNVRIAHPSTPANYFRLLLDQVSYGRPTIVFTPKKLLRLKAAVSHASAFEPSAAFEPVLAPAPSRDAEAVRQIVLCSGKIAYEAEAAAGAEAIVVRLEQLYPFPAEALARALRPFPHAEIRWLQEEPENQGAGAWLAPRLEALLGRRPIVIARPENPSPAGSFHGDHDSDQAHLIRRAFTADHESRWRRIG